MLDSIRTVKLLPDLETEATRTALESRTTPLFWKPGGGVNVPAVMTSSVPLFTNEELVSAKRAPLLRMTRPLLVMRTMR